MGRVQWLVIMKGLKLLVIATIITTSTATKPNPKFILTKDRLIGEVPSVSIEFPDGSKDTLILRKFYSNNQDRIEGNDRCNFIGHLAVETSACVGLTGCPESEDVELTIMSSRVNGSPLFKWKRNGDVKRITHEYMKDRNGFKHQDMEGDDEKSDPEFDTSFAELEKSCEEGKDCADPHL